MNLRFKRSVNLIAAILLAALYAAFLGLVTYPLRASLISFPVWGILFWSLPEKFKRFSAYLAILPLSVLTLEIVRTMAQPSIYAFRYIALDRSHYTPSILIKDESSSGGPEAKDKKPKEVYIGEDGFRADPETKRGNPTRCYDVLIGDSMIYGLGLPYSRTLRPVLQTMHIDACVFGVTGNSPVDYLATLNYVKDRIADDAHIAIYIYAYNDFVSLRKYLERGLRGLSFLFAKLTGLIDYYDNWRRTTFVQGLLRKATATPRPPLQLWRLKIGTAKELELYWPHDPSQYQAARPLDDEERATFRFFLLGLRKLVANRSWRVSVVFIPDNEEMLANFARSSSTFRDLDLRRVEALKICTAEEFDCQDLTPYLFRRAVAEGRNPYLLTDRHFSELGNRILAEHYASTVKNARRDSPPGL